MATVYTKQARKSKNGTIYAPGKSDSGYIIFKLCENYAGHCRGGIAKTWRTVATGLSLEEAKVLLEKRAGA